MGEAIAQLTRHATRENKLAAQASHACNQLVGSVASADSGEGGGEPVRVQFEFEFGFVGSQLE